MQHREELALDFWDRKKTLCAKDKSYRDFIGKFYSMLLNYDIGKGDITSNSLIKSGIRISAAITAKKDGILAGIEELIFLNKDLKIKCIKNDGQDIKAGDKLVEIRGPARKILERERTYLNLLQRMSGIATATNNIAKKLANARVAATRKTLWGALDKKAVSAGKGLTHRIGLNDGILIKDNHLEMIGYDFKKAINLVEKKSKYIEIEVETREHALSAAQAMKSPGKKGLFAIMLDNMGPQEIKKIIGEMKEKGLHEHVLVEASGNIKQENFLDYDIKGIDIISMGSITNSAKALNMSQEIKS